jgi:hypothetical protein
VPIDRRTAAAALVAVALTAVLYLLAADANRGWRVLSTC